MNPQQEIARDPQTFVDPKRAVEVGVVDQALPTDRRARLLKVNPHHDFQVVGQPRADLRQAAGVLDCRGRIVNRAGADDHEQPVGIAL